MKFRDSRIIYYLSATVLCLGVLLFIQIRLLSDAFESRNNQFILRSEQMMDKLVANLGNRYHCFELNTEIVIAPNVGLYLIGGNRSGDTIDQFLIKGYGEGESLVYPNPNLNYSEPMEAKVNLQLSFVGSEYEDRSQVDSATLKWVDESYAHTLRDKKTAERIVDTMLLQELSSEHFKTLVNEQNIGVRLVHQPSGSVAYFRNESAIRKATAGETFKANLYEGTAFAKPYVLEIFLADGLQQVGANIIYMIIGLAIVSILAILFMIQFVKLIWRQKKIAESKNDFVNNMTHEFKTPVTNIRLAVETLKRRMNGEGAHDDLLKAIVQENERIDQNLNRILGLSRMDTQLSLEISNETPKGLIQSALESLKIQLSDVDLSVSFKNADAPIAIDSLLMQSVLQAILDNAIKYSSGQPRIQIHCEVVNDTCRMVVKDFGKGMTETELSRSFDKFYRASNGRQHDVKGFGIGLYYAKTVVHKHKGQISAKSKKGHGSEFIIELPVAVAAT